MWLNCSKVLFSTLLPSYQVWMCSTYHVQWEDTYGLYVESMLTKSRVNSFACIVVVLLLEAGNGFTGVVFTVVDLWSDSRWIFWIAMLVIMTSALVLCAAQSSLFVTQRTSTLAGNKHRIKYTFVAKVCIVLLMASHQTASRWNLTLIQTSDKV